MSRKTLKRFQGSFETEQLQRNVEDFLRSSLPDWISDGTMLTGIAVKTTPTTISHLLQRVPKGFVVTDKNAAGVVHRISWDSTSIILQSSVASTLNIWVF